MTEQNVQETPTVRDEMNALIERLNRSRDRYLRALNGICEEHAIWQRADDRWSILQCAEHVAVAERQMMSMWEKLAAPGKADRAKDASLLKYAHDRVQKNNAPERSAPKGRFATLAEALEQFKAARVRTLEFVRGVSLDELRAKVVQHPLAGEIDGYQLLTLMALHPERHALQIEEIQSAPGFPTGAQG